MDGILGTTTDGSFQLWEVFCLNGVFVGRQMISAVNEDFENYRQLNSPFARKLSFENEAVATTFDVLIENENTHPTQDAESSTNKNTDLPS